MLHICTLQPKGLAMTKASSLRHCDSTKSVLGGWGFKGEGGRFASRTPTPLGKVRKRKFRILRFEILCLQDYKLLH